MEMNEWILYGKKNKCLKKINNLLSNVRGILEA